MVRVSKVRAEFYSENGLRQFSIRIKNTDGSYRQLIGKTISLTLVNSQNRETYSWSSSDIDAEHKLTISTDATSDKITFPEIKSWDMDTGLHQGDLTEIDTTNYKTILQTLQFPFVKNF